VQLFHFGFIVLSFSGLVRKYARQAINRLPFPSCDLRRVDLVLRRDLLRRLVATQRFKRYRALNLSEKTASLGHFCILSSRLDTS